MRAELMPCAQHFWGAVRPSIDDAQREQLRRAVLHNPTEHGFGTELWTLKRVGARVRQFSAQNPPTRQ